MTEKNHTDFKYVQIGGNFKSGTSLLSSILDDHPDLAAFPGETGITGYLFPLLSDPAVSRGEKMTAIVDYRCKKQDGNIPLDVCNYAEVGRRFSKDAVHVAPKLVDLHYAFLEAFYAEFKPGHLETASVWIDKSPLSHLFADDLFATFPEMKFIHLLRDPKDNFASVGGSFLKRVRSKVKRESLLWRFHIWSAQSFYYAKRNQEKFGAERYKVVRFRDLCQKPAEIVPEIAQFLEIPELEILYQPTRAGFAYGGNNKEGLRFDGIFAGNVDRWSERIPPYYARVMENQPTETLHHFGYQYHFDAETRAQAARKHKLAMTFIPKRISMEIYDPRHFQRPAPDVPGI